MDVQTSVRLRWHRAWVALGGAIMLWTLWMALTPDPGITLAFPYGDKLLHATTFTCLMGWWGNVYRARRPRGWAALGCLAFGIFIEFAQWLDPPRDADALDVLADGAGIVIALLLLRTPLASVLASVEGWSVRQRGD
ncbi:VanZ family protein [Rhodanobacter sp. B2A1Ga4]|uniref:VanZ family protein n=1 Tax=Rhodanobacter sp. B2A1Ga4 TaxID=2778647 RepID=UPI001B367DCC|nr:VanZ family protein [Rhodanobacter sp. B2A1Ga4]MBQ4854976.1 VanZ family protein [Rhodanobacter sp. B2A1Ga4]